MFLGSWISSSCAGRVARGNRPSFALHSKAWVEICQQWADRRCAAVERRARQPPASRGKLPNPHSGFRANRLRKWELLGRCEEQSAITHFFRRGALIIPPEAQRLSPGGSRMQHQSGQNSSRLVHSELE